MPPRVCATVLAGCGIMPWVQPCSTYPEGSAIDTLSWYAETGISNGDQGPKIISITQVVCASKAHDECRKKKWPLVPKEQPSISVHPVAGVKRVLLPGKETQNPDQS